jgi:hypothetical protein
MEKYLVGQSRTLLTPAAFTKDSAVRLELLGREDNMTRESPLNGLVGQTLVYGKEGLRLKTAEFAEFDKVVLSIELTKPGEGQIIWRVRFGLLTRARAEHVYEET